MAQQSVGLLDHDSRYDLNQVNVLSQNNGLEEIMEKSNSQKENNSKEKTKKIKYEDIPESILNEKKAREVEELKEAKDELLKKISKEEYEEILKKEKKNEFAPERRTQEELEAEDKRVMKILEQIRKEQ